jgi:tripartite-type tricarboxylate transporter receptor subunit TctC
MKFYKNRFYKKVLVVMLSVLSAAVGAAPWPNGKTIRIIQGFSPASAPQTLSLEIAKILTDKTGASVYVESKQGANGNISAEFVAKSPPDGQTLYVATTGTLSINPSLYKHLSFDPKKDFQPIVLLGYVPNVIIVNKKFPATSLKEFVAYAKSHPGKVNYGTSGVGSSQHLAMEQFSIEAGIKLAHIPYGTGNAVTDLIGGQIEAMFHQLPPALGFIQAGSIRALAVSTKTRVPVVQNVPTVAESGYPGFESVTWFGLFAPRGTPQAVVEKLNALLSDELEGALGKKMQAIGIIPQASTPQQLATMVAQDTIKWHGIIEKIGLQPN